MTLNKLTYYKLEFTNLLTRNKNSNLYQSGSNQWNELLLSIYNRKSVIQRILTTDEGGPGREETTIYPGEEDKRGDEMMEVQGHLRKLGLWGFVWQLWPEQPPEAETGAGRGILGD